MRDDPTARQRGTPIFLLALILLKIIVDGYAMVVPD